jgi:hypothetical protein
MFLLSSSPFLHPFLPLRDFPLKPNVSLTRLFLYKKRDMYIVAAAVPLDRVCFAGVGNDR